MILILPVTTIVRKLLPVGSLVVILWLGPLARLSHAAQESKVDTSPHIVILLLDDMGYGDLRCFNPDSKIDTPHINQLAKAGVRFTDAHAPGPLCHMSRYGLLTGQYPFRIDVSLWPKKPLIQPDQLTIASLAKRNGYRTHMVGKWHLGFLEQGYNRPLPGGPVDCGFDSFFGIRASTDIPPYFYIRDDQAWEEPSSDIPANRSEDWSPIQGAFWRQGKIASNMKLEEVTPRFTTEAVSIIQQHARESGEQPLFLYVAFPSPHTPWLPSKEFEGASKVGLYGDFVMTVDQQIGKITQALDEQGMSDNTLLILTSDNGPVWYPEDVQRFEHDSAGGYRGMKADAWEAGHRMPMIVRWPRVTKPGSECRQLVCFTDFLATFAQLLEGSPPQNLPGDSFSFLDQLTGQAANNQFPSRETWVMQAGSVASTKVVRAGQWKLINAAGSGGFTRPNRIAPGPDSPAGQLYDLSLDPGEKNNLYDQHPELVSKLRTILETTLAQPPHRQGTR